jgi:hypothetical protein
VSATGSPGRADSSVARAAIPAARQLQCRRLSWPLVMEASWKPPPPGFDPPTPAESFPIPPFVSPDPDSTRNRPPSLAFCKQEVAGSIPADSTDPNPLYSPLRVSSECLGVGRDAPDQDRRRPSLARTIVTSARGREKRMVCLTGEDRQQREGSRRDWELGNPDAPQAGARSRPSTTPEGSSLQSGPCVAHRYADGSVDAMPKHTAYTSRPTASRACCREL